MNIIELSEIQQLLFSVEQETIEEICSIIIRSDYFENNEKRNLLFSNISLLIDLRPKQFDQIIDLCILLNKMDPTNSFSSQLLNCLLDKLSQEQQYFIFKGYNNDLFSFNLIASSIEYLINSSQERKAYNLGRWFTEELYGQNRLLYGKISSFNFLRSSESELFKTKKNEAFLLGIDSKLPDDLKLFDILRNDDLESLQALIKPISEIMTKKKHLLPIGSIYSQLTESSALLDEALSVFDICAYYNSINCFEKLCQLVETSNKYVQSLSQERVKSFNVMHYAIAGGSIQVILYLIDHKFPTDNCIQCAIYFHRNDLIDFFSEIDKEIPSNPMQLLNTSKDIWGTPLFQACHSNNVEVFLQMIHYKSFQTSLNLPLSMPSSLSSLFPNPFFYNLNLYLFIYDNIIKSQKAIGKEVEQGNEPYFKFKNFDDADSHLSTLLSSVKYAKEMLINGLFYLSKKGYVELLELMIKELLRTSKLTEKLLNEMPNHEHDDIFQFTFDLNTTDQFGNTILIIASKFNQISCVKLLINIYQVLHDLSKLDEENENESNLSYLNLDAVNNEGRSALDYACFNGNYEIVELLISTDHISIENLHKSLIACLRNCSYCNAHNCARIIHEYNYFLNIYNMLYPYSFANPNYSRCTSDGRKLNKKCESCFERIINSILDAIQHIEKVSLMDSSSSDILSTNSSDESIVDKIQGPNMCFSVYLKTIEKYSIETDNVEIFKILMSTPETLKNLSKTRCVEIINDAIDHNSINILKYIFSNFEKQNNENISNKCPITVDTKINFLKEAISAKKYDVSSYLFSLGLFDLTFDDVFIGLSDPDITRLIFEQKSDLIINKINERGKNNYTLLTDSAKNQYVETFKFLQSLPSVNINAIGKEKDSINISYENRCNEIFVMCIKNPTMNMKLGSFYVDSALERIAFIGDPICAKLILEKFPNFDITERPIINEYDYYHRLHQKTGKSIMDFAYYYDRAELIEYFNYYLAINNKKPYVPQQTGLKGDNQKKVDLKEEDLNIEKAIIGDDLESLKKLINKDNVNMHFERNGITPLNTAIQFEFIDIIQYLLSIPEIDVNLQNDGRSRNNYVKYPEKVENYNIDSFQQNLVQIGETPLITAIKTMNIDIIKLLLAIPSIDINKESKDQSLTPLIQAIKYKKTMWALKSGKRAVIGVQKTPEETAIEESTRQAVINLLLNMEGIDVNKIAKNSVPLVEAVKSKQIETVKLMCNLFTNLPEDSKKIKLDFEQLDGLTKKTALQLANDETIKKILLNSGAKEIKTEKKSFTYTKDNVKVADDTKSQQKTKPSTGSLWSSNKISDRSSGWPSSKTSISNGTVNTKTTTENANESPRSNISYHGFNVNKQNEKQQTNVFHTFGEKMNHNNSKPKSEDPRDKKIGFFSPKDFPPQNSVVDNNSRQLGAVLNKTNDKNKFGPMAALNSTQEGMKFAFSASYTKPESAQPNKHVWGMKLNENKVSNGWGHTMNIYSNKGISFAWQKANQAPESTAEENSEDVKEQAQKDQNAAKDELKEVKDSIEEEDKKEEGKDENIEN